MAYQQQQQQQQQLSVEEDTRRRLVRAMNREILVGGEMKWERVRCLRSVRQAYSHPNCVLPFELRDLLAERPYFLFEHEACEPSASDASAGRSCPVPRHECIARLAAISGWIRSAAPALLELGLAWEREVLLEPERSCEQIVALVKLELLAYKQEKVEREGQQRAAPVAQPQPVRRVQLPLVAANVLEGDLEDEYDAMSLFKRKRDAEKLRQRRPPPLPQYQAPAQIRGRSGYPFSPGGGGGESGTVGARSYVFHHYSADDEAAAADVDADEEILAWVKEQSAIEARAASQSRPRAPTPKLVTFSSSMQQQQQVRIVPPSRETGGTLYIEDKRPLLFDNDDDDSDVTVVENVALPRF